jgi:hypothetical protein
MRRALVALLVALVAGCGDDDDQGAVPAPPPPEYTEAEVLRKAKLTPNDGGLSYTHRPSRCNIAVVMIGAEEVALYADAGDVVASNPDRTVGVKITVHSDDEQQCHRALTEELSGL